MDFAQVMLLTAFGFGLTGGLLGWAVRLRFRQLIRYMRRRHPNLPSRFGVGNTHYGPLQAQVLTMRYFLSGDYAETHDRELIGRSRTIVRLGVAACAAALCAVIAVVIAYAHSITV